MPAHVLSRSGDQWERRTPEQVGLDDEQLQRRRPVSASTTRRRGQPTSGPR